MERIEATSFAIVLVLATPIAACAAVDPQVGPSQESCGVSPASATGPSGNAGYGSTPYGGYAPSTPSQSCSLDAGSACDDCESKYCCITRTACYEDPVCVCADRAMDACLSSTDQLGTVPSGPATACWNAFASRGTVEQARVACERAWCMGACAIE